MTTVKIEHLLRALRYETDQLRGLEKSVVGAALARVADLAEQYAKEEAPGADTIAVPRATVERTIRILKDGLEAPHDTIVELTALLNGGGR